MFWSSSFTLHDLSFYARFKLNDLQLGQLFSLTVTDQSLCSLMIAENGKYNLCSNHINHKESNGKVEGVIKITSELTNEATILLPRSSVMLIEKRDLCIQHAIS